MSHHFDKFINYAEDDSYRSKHVRRLVQNPKLLLTPVLKTESNIPKIIIQFWDDLNRIPTDVQECFDTWKPLETNGFITSMFDDQKARRFILLKFGAIYLKAYDRCYHPAMRCDYFRLCYILSNGGFYVDADEVYQGKNLDYLFNDNKLKLQPLCYDIETGTMVKPGVFIKEESDSPNWIFYFNNNPIIAPAGHPILHLALERATKILINSKERPEIQSTTGPGNLTASLVNYSVYQESIQATQDFLILSDWESVSVSPWSLSYRNDARNWRLSN
jgi:mannosyltransferase OCH1-like enzyme